jgi:hypothetical protein
MFLRLASFAKSSRRGCGARWVERRDRPRRGRAPLGTVVDPGRRHPQGMRKGALVEQRRGGLRRRRVTGEERFRRPFACSGTYELEQGLEGVSRHVRSSFERVAGRSLLPRASFLPRSGSPPGPGLCPQRSSARPPARSPESKHKNVDPPTTGRDDPPYFRALRIATDIPRGGPVGGLADPGKDDHRSGSGTRNQCLTHQRRSTHPSVSESSARRARLR